MIKGLGYVSLTNGSGSGRPKNKRILWIRIRNTDQNGFLTKTVEKGLTWEGYDPYDGGAPGELPRHQAVGVVALGPVRLVHYQQLHVPGREQTTRQVIRHHLGQQQLYNSAVGIRIRIFLGLPDPDPLVIGMDPDRAPAPDPSLYSERVLSRRK